MPTYQYACTACEHRFDVVQSFTDSALTECPECSGRLRKLYGSVGVVFKGSGFYRTDSRNSATAKEKESAKKDSGAKKDSADKPSSGSSASKDSNSSSSSSGPTTPTAKAS